jgi:LPPG:FO 2-phospho-L-lactate transferase
MIRPDPRYSELNVVALAGGVGGARLADGLYRLLPPERLTVIVNVGDDFEHLGLRICPDIDTVVYTLAGLGNPATGWGRSNESYAALETLGELGGPAWFRLGDRDLGLHLERTRRLQAGETLSEVTQRVCRAWGVQARVLPVSDDPVPTIVLSDEGELAFQEYFVRRGCRPRVRGFRFDGAPAARPAQGVIEAFQAADVIVVCPSNPWVSVDPLLAVPGVRAAIERRRQAGAAVVAVSPIIGGQAVKGPAAKMFTELGIDPSALAVARHYADLCTGFLLDVVDSTLQPAIAETGLKTFVTDTLMKTPADRLRLAAETIAFAAPHPNPSPLRGEGPADSTPYERDGRALTPLPPAGRGVGGEGQP